MMNGLVLAALPVITGLQAVLWSQIVGVSRPGAALVNVISAVAIFAILYTISQRGSFSALFQGTTTWFVLGYFAVSIVTALLWIAALQTSSIAAIGFVEIGYPLFILLFAYLLLGRVELSATHYLGAAMIFLGTITVVISNHQ